MTTETPTDAGTATPTPADVGQAGGQEGAGTKPGEGVEPKPGEPGKAGEPAKGPPDKYEFKMPEGVEVDAQALEAFTPVLKDVGLNQEQAQKLVDVFAQHQARQAEAAQQAHDTMVADWAKAAKGDKEFGGVKFDENLAVAQRAIARFASPELKQMLNEWGLGNHPELLRFCYRVGKGISEDAPPQAGQDGSGKRDAAEVLYGKPA